MKIIRVAALIFIFAGLIVFVIRYDKIYRNNKVIQLGLTKGQDGYFQKQLRETGKQYAFIERGIYYLENGDFDASIKMFEDALQNAYSQGTKGEAIIHLADAYEKKRDYDKALEYIVLDRDEYINDWAKAPVVERAKYLEYAASGEYELAVEQAEKALIVETNMPYNKGVPSEGYVQRVNDIKASKEYIEALKK
jgi:tetratricopeptide (TPR) repeat protein